MRRPKLAFVSLLSLLIVLAPVSSVLAQNEPVEKPVNEKSQQTKQKAEKGQTSVFEEIEKQGGNEVTDKKLDQEEGEGWLGAAVGALTGAVSGAATSVGHYLWNKSVMGHEVPDVHEVGHRAWVGASVGAASGAFFGGVVGGPF